MARFTPTKVTLLSTALPYINQNFDQLSALMERVLMRDGAATNTVTHNIDVNHFRLVNVADATVNADAINLGQVKNLISGLHGADGAQGPKGDPGSPGEGYATRSLMAARLAPAIGDDVYLTESGRLGKFVVVLASAWTTSIAADVQQGIFVTSTADVTKVYMRVAALLGERLNVRWFGALGNGSANDYTAIQATLTYAQFLTSATIYFPIGTYNVGTAPVLTHAKGINIIGDGPDHTIIVATGTNAAFATLGAWRCKFEGIMFKQGSARTSAGATFELEGENDGSFGVQGMHFERCYFNANGLADRALAICRVSGGNGQGSENVFIDCNADNALLANVDVMGNNALQNTWIGGNIQGHRMDGIRKSAGSINVISTGFQSTFSLQLDNGGADIANLGSVGDRMLIENCRTESFVFFRGGGDVTLIRGCLGTPGVASTRGNSAAIALGAYQTGITATGAQRLYKCTTAGTTGASVPTWPDSGTVADGTAVWTHFEFSVMDKADYVEHCQFFYGNVSGTRPLSLYRACMFGRPDILKSTDSGYLSGGGPVFDNCAWAANGAAGNPKALGPFGNNSKTGARYVHPDGNKQPMDIRDGAIIARDGTGGGTYYDLVWKRWAGDYNLKRKNYWGTPNGIKFGEIAFTDIGSVSDVGVVWFVTDGTPGSSPLTGSGTGCLAIYQNGAWKAIS